MTEDPDEHESPGSLRPTSAWSLFLAALLGLAGGFLLRVVAVPVLGSPPLIGWAQGLVLFFVAAIIGYVAWHTWQTIHVRRVRLEPHKAVNRLVLARACALVGALVAGGYTGYALTWIGDPAELADQRLLRGLVAAAGGLLVMIAALFLERACRVPKDDPEP